MVTTGIGRLARLSDIERSVLMGKIRSKDTKPEMLVQRYLHASGLRYRLHDVTLPGKPDIVLSGQRIVIFVQGCFWHWHGAACSIKPGKPRTNPEKWEAKLRGNVARDERHQQALREAGWQVLTVWECELKKAVRGATLHRLLNNIVAADEHSAEWTDELLAA
jgi:DNA mismatch endonuclease (patch repair protein)